MVNNKNYVGNQQKSIQFNIFSQYTILFNLIVSTNGYNFKNYSISKYCMFLPPRYMGRPFNMIRLFYPKIKEKGKEQ